MNNTITLSQLISRVAEATGCDVNTSRRFLRELFATVCECLEKGESVDVPGIGTFSRSDEQFGREAGVDFIPDKALADEINKPFAMFESVELADDFNPATLEAADGSDEAAEETDQAMERRFSTSEPDQPESEPAPDQAMERRFSTSARPEEPEAEPEPTPEEPEPAEEPAPAPTPTPAPVEEPAPAPKYRFPEEEDEEDAAPIEEERKPSYRWLWILIGAIIIGCVAGYFVAANIDVDVEPADEPAGTETLVADPTPDDGTETPVAETAPGEVPADADIQPAQAEEPAPAAAAAPAPAPAAASAPAPAAPTPVYETIDAHNYLSVIARRHYGVQNYWIFIYEANSDVLRDPDRIAPGTRVVVPPVESLPGSTTEERRAIAARKIGELARQRR